MTETPLLKSSRLADGPIMVGHSAGMKSMKVPQECPVLACLRRARSWWHGSGSPGRPEAPDCHVQAVSVDGKTVTLSTSAGPFRVQWQKVRATDRKEVLFAEYSRELARAMGLAPEGSLTPGPSPEKKWSEVAKAQNETSRFERKIFTAEEGTLPYRIPWSSYCMDSEKGER
jgi:hypothetical protein